MDQLSNSGGFESSTWGSGGLDDSGSLCRGGTNPSRRGSNSGDPRPIVSRSSVEGSQEPLTSQGVEFLLHPFCLRMN